MSCVAAVVWNDKVWMGADSAASDGEDMVDLVAKKLFFNGDFLIGTVGSLRLTQILCYRLVIPKYDEKQSLEHFMAVEFTDAVRAAFHDNGFSLMPAPNGDQPSGVVGSFLVGYNGRIFRVEGDLQFLERADKFEAIGCGSPYALGALAQSTGGPPLERLGAALWAATHFSAHVRDRKSVV